MTFFDKYKCNQFDWFHLICIIDFLEMTKTEGENGRGEESSTNEDEYVVEKVVKHRKSKRGTEYFVKWEGYNESDNTWEHESNVYCEELLKEYWDSIKESLTKRKSTEKVYPTRKKVEKKRVPVRQMDKIENVTDDEVEEEMEELVLDNDYPPAKVDWNDIIDHVESVNKDKNRLYAYIIWQNGCHTKHDIQECNEKCPQQLLQYFQSKINIDYKD